MFHRMITLFCTLAVLFAFPLSAGAAAPFTFADVQARAQDLAGTKYVPASPVPDYLTKLNYSSWSSIRCLPEKALWAEEALPFTVQFFHPGLYYDRPVQIHVVNNNDIEDIAFDTSFFQYGNKDIAEQVTQESHMNFAGFRLHYPLNRSDYKDEVAIFLGASYFRALAAGTHYGIYSRGLAIDTAMPQGEEFPYFKEFWIVKPAKDAESITVYALMDSESLSGAYRFIITPGAPTVMDIKCALFTRSGAKNIQKIGLAPLTSMFFYGEEKNGRPGDYRPEVHNSDGLLYIDGETHWFWRPLTNPKRLSVNTFPLQNPHGFGLLQRDSSFSSYQDVESAYESRPSLWIEPQGDWGSGTLNLVEIPTEDEWHDNIVAFWSPDKPRDKAKTDQPEADIRYPDTQIYNWKLYWIPPKSPQHNLGQISSTRISRIGDTMTFHIDFSGKELDALPSDTGLASIVETPEPIPLLEKKLLKNTAAGGWRLTFTIRLPKEDGMLQNLMAARKGPITLRFRALLKKGENLPDPLTETWIYDWQLQPQ